jgi:hypothetical protein
MLGLDVTAIDTTAKFKVGTVFSDIGVDGPEKCYKYVLFNNGTGNVAAVVGDFAYYYLAAGLASNTVTMVLTDGAYGWVQVSGNATLTTAPLAGADGNALTAVGATTDGTLDVSALVTDAICAIAGDISAKQVILCCPK